MTSSSDTQGSAVGRPAVTSNQTSRSFFIGLLAIALMLIATGIGAFWYLTANGPLSLLAKRDRPIATATAFVPASAPFTFSLLTNPDKLIMRQQALPDVDPQQVLAAAEQIEQAFFEDLPLDYDRDISSWLGDEVTIACTQLDLDFDKSNGQQPGYLLALEIAPARSQQAKESLRLFWQAQSLSGYGPISEQLNGVRLLYSEQDNRNERPSRAFDGFSRLGTASALVGDRFVLFANDIQVIRRSLRATETATNLAQDRTYRGAAGRLPTERIGLARWDTAAFVKDKQRSLFASSPKSDFMTGSMTDFVTASLELSPTGLTASAQVPGRLASENASSQSIQSAAGSLSLLQFIPSDSAIALASRDLGRLESVLDKANFSSITLPDFLQLRASKSDEVSLESTASPWAWVKGDYAIAQERPDKSDWILVVDRSAEDIDRMDRLAEAQGYNAVPLSISSDDEEQEAIAWTKFKASTQRRRSSTLETEILGLHIQQTVQQSDLQGDFEIFASSIAAMNDALNAPKNSLLGDLDIAQWVVDTSREPDIALEGYLYVDWPAVTFVLAQDPIFKRVESALRPVTSQIDTLSATKFGQTVKLFARFDLDRQTQSRRANASN